MIVYIIGVWLMIAVIFLVVEFFFSKSNSIWGALSALIVAAVSFWLEQNYPDMEIWEKITLEFLLFSCLLALFLAIKQPIMNSLREISKEKRKSRRTTTKVISIIDEAKLIYEIKFNDKIYKAQGREKFAIGDEVIIKSFVGSVAQIKKNELTNRRKID